MSSAAPDSENTEELARLSRQRNLAVVCAVLVGAMTTAMLWFNFGRESPVIEEERAAVSRHRKLVAEHRKILSAVNAILQIDQQEVKRLSQAKSRSP